MNGHYHKRGRRARRRNTQTMGRPAQAEVGQQCMVQGGKTRGHWHNERQAYPYQISPRSSHIWPSGNQQNNATSRMRLLVAKDEAGHNGLRQGLCRLSTPQGQQPAYTSGISSLNYPYHRGTIQFSQSLITTVRRQRSSYHAMKKSTQKGRRHYT